MKLHFYIDSQGKKVYTLHEEQADSKEKTTEAHYKFIKIRDAQKSDIRIVRKN